MSFSINADPFESPTAAIGCTAHCDTDSIHVVKNKTRIYEEEGGGGNSYFMNTQILFLSVGVNYSAYTDIHLLRYDQTHQFSRAFSSNQTVLVPIK